MTDRNIFIAIEGIDGAGKTTVCHLLGERLSATQYKTPSSPFADTRARIDERVNFHSRFYYYLASVFHASAEIATLLKDSSVVCDRYILSTVCFHKAADASLAYFDDSSLPLLQPDVTFFLNADYDTRIKRIASRENMPIHAVKQQMLHDAAYQEQVKAEFQKYPHLIWIDTGSLAPEAVVDNIVQTINPAEG